MANTTWLEKEPLVDLETGGHGLKMGLETRAVVGHIQAPGIERNILPAARKGLELPLLASMPRGTTQLHARRDTAGEDPDALLGWLEAGRASQV